MPVKALYDYDFPSADRVENFGDDQLVYVHWLGNPLFCSAAAFRAPRDIPFGTFLTEIVWPWAGSDPDFDPSQVAGWQLFDEQLTPDDGASLTDLGIGHKALLKFRTE
ncbi:phenol hydroxylase subunit P4 [Flexivirga oryzae]|uniref:Phenol hydroxylase P4 protein n=1 Tax=Flexivirga oryzae TaxID=1794944 RepID=A0A839N9V1_9MICO|nr:phenol hydroxylase subunit P4 [Flexivirga oryzae]MBB2891985.1 phenol hydroxylase P4 protein [Flexivirga oryzae]